MVTSSAGAKFWTYINYLWDTVEPSSTEVIHTQHTDHMYVPKTSGKLRILRR